MRVVRTALLLSGICILVSCNLTPVVRLDQTVEGVINLKSKDDDWPYYYQAFRGSFVEGQTYTVEVLSLDGAPIHFNMNVFDLDFQCEEHEVETFEADTDEEVRFTVYLHYDYIEGDMRFAFRIVEGLNGPAVYFQSDAQRVAEAIVSDFFSAVPWVTGTTCTNKTVRGNIGGTAVVNGKLTKTQPSQFTTRMAYSDMSVVFDSFQNNQRNPVITGTGGIVGTVSCTSSYSTSNSYSGSWVSSGTLTLSGIFNGSVEFSFTHRKDYPSPWSGTLTTEEDVFTVSSAY